MISMDLDKKYLCIFLKGNTVVFCNVFKNYLNTYIFICFIIIVSFNFVIPLVYGCSWVILYHIVYLIKVISYNFINYTYLIIK